MYRIGKHYFERVPINFDEALALDLVKDIDTYVFGSGRFVPLHQDDMIIGYYNSKELMAFDDVPCIQDIPYAPILLTELVKREELRRLCESL